MRPLERVARTRRVLAIAVAVRALLWATTTALGTAALAALASHRLSGVTPAAGRVAAATAAIAVLAVLLEPWRRLSVSRVALWIEERVPDLEYALVSAVDPRYATGAAASRLERAIDRATWDAITRRAVSRAMGWPLVGVALAAAVLFGARRLAPATGAAASGPGVTATTASPRTAPEPFARLTATVRAPAYAGGRTVHIESPASIAALAGSSILLEAPGTGEGVSAELGEATLPVRRAGDAWRVALTLGSRPSLVRLRHASGERLVALEPRVDSVPTVRLMLPARDTVLRLAQGVVPLAAEVHDDVGLVSGAFEYIVSSGEGESFQFRSGTVGARQFGGAGSGSLGASLTLGGLALRPGDIVHLRAVARDANTVSGPGVGASETRVVRIARAGEYDSVAVEGAPPPEADKSMISQRMLILLTEALDRRRPRLAREMLLAESRGIARDQTRLRKRVGDIIFARLGDNPTGEHEHDPGEEPAATALVTPSDSAARDSTRRAAARAGQLAAAMAAADSADSARAALLRAASAATGGGAEILDFEGDETPVVAINRPLLEAYNAMWEASRELDQGETERALPPMRRALAAIQRARQAERIYLRGKAPTVVVDLARIRLTGKEAGAPGTRAPRPPVDPAAARRADRLAAAIALASQAPAAAIDSLVLLRVEVLDDAPPLAAALGQAVDAMRRGRDATSLLARARRIADGSVRGGGLGAWSGVW